MILNVNTFGGFNFFSWYFCRRRFFYFCLPVVGQAAAQDAADFPSLSFRCFEGWRVSPSAKYSPPPSNSPTFTPVVLSVELRRTIRLSKLQRGKKTSPWSSPPPGYFCCFYFSTRLGWIGVALTLKIFIKMLLLWSHYLLRRHLCLKKASVTFTPSFLWSKELFLFPNQ